MESVRFECRKNPSDETMILHSVAFSWCMKCPNQLSKTIKTFHSGALLFCNVNTMTNDMETKSVLIIGISIIIRLVMYIIVATITRYWFELWAVRSLSVFSKQTQLRAHTLATLLARMHSMQFDNFEWLKNVNINTFSHRCGAYLELLSFN